ncbi:MAG: hypothetical protein WCL38_06220 [Actinomycetota bacterium]
MKIRTLVIAAGLSVVLAAVAILVVVGVVQPVSPVPADASKPVLSSPSPAGTTAGTAPTSTFKTWVTSSSSQGNHLSELNLESKRVLRSFPLEDSGRATSLAQAGPTLAAGFSGPDHGGLLSFWNAKSGLHQGSVVVPGSVLDLNGATDGRTFDVLVEEGNQQVALSMEALSQTPTRTVNLPSSTLGMVLSPDRSQIYALRTGGRLAYVDAPSGNVKSSIQVNSHAFRIGLSNDGLHFYVLCHAGTSHDRVDVVSVTTGRVTSSLFTSASTMWILPTIDNARLVTFVGNAGSGRVEEFRLTS